MSGPFSRISQGPFSAAGTDTSKQSLSFDRQNNIVGSIDDLGNDHSLQSALVVLGPQTALSSITTVQNLINQTLNARALNKLNRMLEIICNVIFTVSSGTPTCTITLKLGSVTLATITTAALAASTNGQIQINFLITVTTTGTSGVIEAHGSVIAQLSTNLATALAEYADQVSAGSSTIDLTASQALTLQISSNTGIASAQVRQALVTVLA